MKPKARGSIVFVATGLFFGFGLAQPAAADNVVTRWVVARTGRGSGNQPVHSGGGTHLRPYGVAMYDAVNAMERERLSTRVRTCARPDSRAGPCSERRRAGAGHSPHGGCGRCGGCTRGVGRTVLWRKRSRRFGPSLDDAIDAELEASGRNDSPGACRS